MTSEGQGFEIERQGDVVLIRFADPATRNALSMSMADGLLQHLRASEKEARAIVIAGDERAFCSGAKLNSDEASNRRGSFDVGLRLENHFNPLMMALRDLRIPLITAVRGAAAGIGASLALIGDLIIAGPNAYFQQAFGRIGLIPDGGSPWLLVNAIGRIRAMELLLLGDSLPAQQAYEWGLVTRLVDDEEVEPVAMSLAHRLAEGPAMAIALTRRAAWAAAEASFEAQLQLERQLQTVAGYHPDFAEGVSAFLQKRAANFAPTLTPEEHDIITRLSN